MSFPATENSGEAHVAAPAFLKASHVAQSFAGAGFAEKDSRLDVLKDVNLELFCGQPTAIMGRSGCGKSTLVSILAGLERPASGTAEIMGRDWSKIPPRELNLFRAENLGIVFQQFFLIDHLTAHENVRLPLDLSANKKGESSDERASHLLARVGLQARGRHFPGQLSRGEQQRCAIARVLARRPRILLADEPTGSLDAKTGAEILDLLFALAEEEAMAMLLVTHDQALAKRCARVLDLVDGRLIENRAARR